MPDVLLIRTADTDDVYDIEELAKTIWPVAYAKILSPEQLQYMLETIYSPDALAEQMDVKKHQFVMAEIDERPVGFASYSRYGTSRTFKLHKLYVLPDMQGKGLGRTLLDFVVEQVIEQDATSLLLNVNRFNKAIPFYQKYGFEIISEEDIDIGNGYFMNDYVMEKKLANS